jgi:AbrB family looped-hinge helix DNA binding protein
MLGCPSCLWAFPIKWIDKEDFMEIVIVSPEFQVVIPQAIREALGIQPGQQFQVLVDQNRIELIPLRSVQEMRGFLKGLDTTVAREPDRI